jgi:glutamine cyclotransferase
MGETESSIPKPTHRVMLPWLMAVLVLALPWQLPSDRDSGIRALPQIHYRVIRVLPHDPSAFTEGLLWHAGSLFESTGLVGSSTLRELDPNSGRTRRQVAIPSYFAEGLALWQGHLYQLTLHDQRVLIWDTSCLCQPRVTTFSGQGWGLTSNDHWLYVSDGSDRLRIIDPTTMSQLSTLRVESPGGPLPSLNALQWTPQGIYANFWPSDVAVVINPNSGRVISWLDLSQLGDRTDRADLDNVPNGIAFLPSGHLMVTGKRWRHLYELDPTTPRISVS